MGSPVIHFNAKQQAIWDDWVKRGPNARAKYPHRYGPAAMARKLGISADTCKKRMARHMKGSPFKHRVSPKVIEKEYISAREAKAERFDHTKVTAKDISAKIQVGRDKKFKSTSRVQTVARGKSSLRTPAASPRYGDRAKTSQEITYLLHHRR